MTNEPFLKRLIALALAPAESVTELRAALQDAEAQWPVLRVTETFADFLAVRLPEDGSLAERLASVRLADLLLAWAVLDGQAAALRAIEGVYMGDVVAAVRRVRGLGDRADDVAQSLRQQFFVGDSESPPKLRDYQGRGDLRGWLRVSATRAALKAVRHDHKFVSDEDADLAERAGSSDPELAYVKALYRDHFRAAFQQAIDSLDARDQTLLRQNVLDGVSIDELGTLYQVHRATAARWLASAREELVARTRRNFKALVKMSDDECDSVMNLVQSQLDATIRRRLRGMKG